MRSFCVYLILVLVLLGVVAGQCPNGCSNRGLCVNNACQCAEGLSGVDCSVLNTYTKPTLYQCPECYTVTVGAPRYYSGPSWRLPDGPITALNYKGTLKMYQGNGNGEMISVGVEIDDWLQAPVEALKSGDAAATVFDQCGSWIMRAFTGEVDKNKILGFYHAERFCNYAVGGQTRKSAGYAVSADGGQTFTKPGYPSNKLIDTSTPEIVGQPTGEGDFGVILRGNYYYLFFANVETYYTGVARATVWSEAYPGAFSKYYNGQWNSPGQSGNSSRLNNISGPQVYLHTPSQSIVAVGSYNPYWNRGFMFSASDDAINWKYMADPLITPDPITMNDQYMYPSLMGPSGGYEVGNKFSFFYMWIPPQGSWSARYQVLKDIALTYVGPNATNVVGSKTALTTFVSTTNGEIWQSTELPLAPYNTISILGYIMTRAYPNTLPIYDCLNSATGDHFVGTSAECYLGGSSVTVTRALGFIYATRAPGSIAVYRCSATNDKFLSTATNCEGKASPQTVPFGYVLDGPVLSNSAKGFDVLIPKGSSWKFYNKSLGADLNWTKSGYNEGTWMTGISPFGNLYAGLVKTYFGKTNHYFRTTFTIPSGSTVKKLLVSVASDNYAVVYINGVLVDSDPLTWHEAAYWNRRVYVDASMLVVGSNQISVITYNMDDWSFFDLELSVKYADTVPTTPVVCNPTCVNGQCNTAGVCVCDSGWSGSSCSNSVCSYSALSTQTPIPSGSTFKYTSSTPSPGGWFATSFDDSKWSSAVAPFGTTFYYNGYMAKPTTISNVRYLYRKSFSVSIPTGKVIYEATLGMSTDDTHRVYVNGKFVGSPVSPYNGHYAKKWNDVIKVPGTFLISGTNVVAVEVPLVDGRWSAYFNMELNVTFATKSNC